MQNGNIQPEVKILHVFRANNVPFRFTWDDVNYNLMRMAYSHFKEERSGYKRLFRYGTG
jgi:hypothetical protein